MIHARYQYHPLRHWMLDNDGRIRLDARGRRVPKPRHRGDGTHPLTMPRPLRAQRPELFDGTWRTPQQRARDALKATP